MASEIIFIGGYPSLLELCSLRAAKVKVRTPSWRAAVWQAECAGLECPEAPGARVGLGAAQGQGATRSGFPGLRASSRVRTTSEVRFRPLD